jgi:hypothetical protein
MLTAYNAPIYHVNMQYSQLGFFPRGRGRRGLLEQAEFLLRELVAGQIHKPPCKCGACIYWTYRQGAKTEGRRFDVRRFFVYFLRTAFLHKVLMDTRHLTGAAMTKKAWNLFEIALGEDIRDRARKVPIHSGYSLYWSEVREATRTQTLAMIKDLHERRQPPAAKKALAGILNKKVFYSYYNRAGDPRLDQVVQAARLELGRHAGPGARRAVEFMATLQEKNSIKGDKKTLPRKRRSFDRIPENPHK